MKNMHSLPDVGIWTWPIGSFPRIYNSGSETAYHSTLRHHSELTGVLWDIPGSPGPPGRSHLGNLAQSKIAAPGRARKKRLP